jgi:hypothetical protein
MWSRRPSCLRPGARPRCHQGIDQPECRCWKIVAEPVVDPETALLRFDQASRLQLAHVVGDRGLLKVKGCREVTDADRRSSLAKTPDHGQPGWVGKRLEKSRVPECPILICRQLQLAAQTLMSNGKLGHCYTDIL